MLVADEDQMIIDTSQETGQDTKVYLYSLWGTAVGAIFIISVMSFVCYKMKKRLNAANQLLRNVKRNNVIVDSL